MVLDLNGTLGLLGMLKDGAISALRNVFEGLNGAVATAAKGSKMRSISLGNKKNGEREIRITAEDGEKIGWLRLMDLSRVSRPFKCFYLIYVKIADGYVRQGLGASVVERFTKYLEKQRAIGILDNTIPKFNPSTGKRNPAYNMYARRGWKPLSYFKINGNGNGNGYNYMIYIPFCLKGKKRKLSLERVLSHLKENEEAIQLRENVRMVKGWISELLRLYSAMLTFFQTERDEMVATPLLRFVFTMLVTKLIYFRRKIKSLKGFTGGESLEQFLLDPWVASASMKSYLPNGLAKGRPTFEGDRDLWEALPEELRQHPARFIEQLPNYMRPWFLAWCRKKGRHPNAPLMIGDLIELDFDPTRMKEIILGGKKYIVERVQFRPFGGLEKSLELLNAVVANHPAPELWTFPKKPALWTNPPLLAVKDRGNAYIFREKIGAIHWEEAVDQLRNASDRYQHLNTRALVRMLIGEKEEETRPGRERAKGEVEKLGEEIRKLFPHLDFTLDELGIYVPWSIETNLPLLSMDGDGFLNIWLTI